MRSMRLVKMIIGTGIVIIVELNLDLKTLGEPVPMVKSWMSMIVV